MGVLRQWLALAMLLSVGVSLVQSEHAPKGDEIVEPASYQERASNSDETVQPASYTQPFGI
jgi:hypothetical protein